MAITVTYDSVLSRVRITATGLGSATTALVERSSNQITWTTVRGGQDRVVSAGQVSLDDYEFEPNAVNYYRVTTPAAITFVAAGTAAHADNANVSPGLPAGLAAGDLLLVFAAIRNTGGGVDFIDGGVGSYSTLVSFTHVKLFGKIAAAGETTPTVHFAGVAGDSTSAQTAAFRNAQLSVSAFATLTNAAGQNINYPALTVEEQAQLILYLGWKHDDWTSVATIAGATEIGEPSTTTGNDQGIVWDRLVQTAAVDITAGSFVVTGGTSDVSKGAVAAFRPSLVQQTNSLTPSLTTVWIKNLARPFLNRTVTVVDFSEITRPARNGVFEVVGRTDPVAVTDLRTSRRYQLTVMVANKAAADDLDLCLAAGDPVLVHVPPTCPFPGIYAVINDTSQSRTSKRGVRRYFTLPLVEVAPPGPDVVGATITWQGVVNAYATWTDVIAGETTWEDLLENIGDPSDVIVP